MLLLVKQHSTLFMYVWGKYFVRCTHIFASPTTRTAAGAPGTMPTPVRSKHAQQHGAGKHNSNFFFCLHETPCFPGRRFKRLRVVKAWNPGT